MVVNCAKRWLAIDYGTRHTGLAISSSVGAIALPLKTLEAKTLWRDLDRVIGQYAPTGLLIGLPLLLNGEESDQTRKTRTFIEQCRERYPQCEVAVFDERLSSKQAERLLQAHGMNRKQRAAASDQTSAWIMLACYLEMGEIDQSRQPKGMGDDQ